MSSIGPFVREIEVFPDPEHLPLPIRREAPATTPATAPPAVEPIKERPLPTNPDTDKPTTEPTTTPVEPEKVPA